jgi:hypothetical protein
VTLPPIFERIRNDADAGLPFLHSHLIENDSGDPGTYPSHPVPEKHALSLGPDSPANYSAQHQRLEHVGLAHGSCHAQAAHTPHNSARHGTSSYLCHDANHLSVEERLVEKDQNLPWLHVSDFVDLPSVGKTKV